MKIKHMAKNALMGVIALSVVSTGVGLSQPSFAASAKSTSTQTAKVSTQAASLNMALPMKSKAYRVSSHYGTRCAPVMGSAFFHGATDMAAPDGTPLYAMLDGKIDSIVQGSATTTGTIRVDHGTVNGKKLLTSYGHMWDSYKYVKVGQTVKKGQQIGEVGSSGPATGPHLHLAVQQGGQWGDPVTILKSLGLDLNAGATSVVKNTNPTICNNLYVSADMGLKKSASITSDTIAVLKRNEPISVYPGASISGFIKVKVNKTGKIGYLTANIIQTKITSNSALPTTTKTSSGIRYTTKTTQNIRSYPSTVAGQSGVLDTLQKGEIMTTTGRKVGTYTEVKFALGTGWIYTSQLMSAPDPAKITGTKSVNKNVLYTPNQSVNLFSYPDTSSSIYKDSIINLKTGAEMRTIGRALGVWTEVTYGGKKYWATTTYIHRTTPALPKLSTTTKSVTYKTKATTYLRNYPSSDTTISWSLYTMGKNASVKTTGKKYSTWIQVSYGTRTGWVNTSQVNRQVAALPKLSTTTKSVSYKTKATTQMRNYPSTSETQGWNVKTLQKNSLIKTTGRKYSSWIEVSSGSTKGWILTTQATRQVAKLPKVSNTSKSVYYKVKVSSAQIRNYPSTSEVQGWNLKTIKKNTKMTTTGKRYGSWYQVKSGSTTGWIYNSKISRTTANLPKLSNTGKNVTYKAKSTQKIMNYPSSSTAKGWSLKTIKKNTKVKTVGKRTGSWYQVKYGSTTGWVYIKNFKR